MLQIDASRENLIVSIPDQLLDGSFRFIRLKKQQKEPFDTKWQTENNFEAKDERIAGYIDKGFNYGVICAANDVCILDADEFARLEQLGALDCFNDTFTVRTGSDKGERYHYYFRCPGLGGKKIPFFDLTDEKQHLGEVYPVGAKAYCVGPNSIHPSGNRYCVVNDSPIKTLTADEIDKVFFSKVKSSRAISRDGTQLMNKMPSKIDSYQQNTITKALGLKIEDFGYPAGNVIKRGDEVQGSHPIHGSSTGMNYSINKTKNVFHCFRCGTGGDPLVFLAI
jgi:hypothetical protein